MSSNTVASGSNKRKLLKKPSRKTLIIVGVLAVICVLAWFIVSRGLIGGLGEGKKVEYTQLDKDKVPKSIETEVIPEYRDLERALGCLVDGKVYVVVTRGEKPTAGYEVDIDDMRLEKTKDGNNLKVVGLFKEPTKGKAVAQMSTYPYAVAKTELTTLPDTIELIVKYAD